MRIPVEPGLTETVPARPARVNLEPMLHTRGTWSAARSMKLELRSDAAAVAVAEADSRRAANREADDVVLPPFLTSGLFAAQIESEPSRWKSRSIWIVGVVCIALGLGLGAVFHRVVSAAQTHITQTNIAKRAVDTFSSQPKTDGSVVPDVASQKNTAETSKTVSVANGSGAGGSGAGGQPEAPGSVSRPTAAGMGSGVPVTVVKQEVTAWPSEPLDPREQTSGAPSSAKTRSAATRPSRPTTATSSRCPGGWRPPSSARSRCRSFSVPRGRS